MKTKKTVIKTVISLSLIIALLFSCVIAADAASYLLDDVNGDGDVDVIDATIVQRCDARFPVPYDEAQLMRGDVDADGNWCVNGNGFGDGLGNNTRSYSIENDGEALKDTTGNYTTKPYVDIIVNSSGKLSAGADAGKENVPSADVKLYMYVDDTMDYDPALAYDPASTDTEHANKVMAKFYKADAFTAENNATSYLVKASVFREPCFCRK